MDIANVEKVEAELDSFIERRAKQNAAENAREMMWKESVRKHHARQREARLWERLHYHQAMLEAHTKNFEVILRRHRVGLRLVEQALGIPHEEERKTA